MKSNRDVNKTIFTVLRVCGLLALGWFLFEWRPDKEIFHGLILDCYHGIVRGVFIGAFSWYFEDMYRKKRELKKAIKEYEESCKLLKERGLAIKDHPWWGEDGTS